MQNKISDLASFFDVEFYLEQIKGEAPKDPLTHYLEIGWKKGLDPSPDFSTDFYLSKYADIRENEINPFEHFVLYGRSENRETKQSKRIDPSVLCLTKGGEIEISVARLLLRAFQPPRPQSTAKIFQISQYLDSGWRDRVPSQRAYLGEEKHVLKEDCEYFDQEEKTRLLAGCQQRRSNKSLVDILTNLADQSWYEQRCESLGVLSPVRVGMDTVTHYLTIGRHFRLSITPVFDIAYYVDSIRNYGDDPVAPENALIHYLTVGEAAGMRPCAFFNPVYYGARYVVADGSPLEYFVRTGAELGHQPSAAFWCEWYRETYEVNTVNLLAHFYAVGIDEGFLPNPLIDIEWYRAQNALTSREDALKHYVLIGFLADHAPHSLVNPDYIRRQEGLAGTRLEHLETSVEFYMHNARDLEPSPLFDTRYYLSRLAHPDNVDQPLAHYIDQKTPGPKCPNPYFFDKFYLLHRKDVYSAKITPLIHYLNIGFREEVCTHPLVDNKYLRETLTNLEGITPLEAVITGQAGEKVELRRRAVDPDVVNKSKWLPVALNIDEASKSYTNVSIKAANVGILAHVFYVDLLPEVIAFAENVPQPSVLLVSTDSFSKQQAVMAALEKANLQNWEVRVIENRGRDIAPSFLGFLDRLETLEYAVHIHTKRSRHYGQSFDKWRNYLFAENGGSRARVEAILRTFEANPTLGALAPTDFSPLRPLISWGHNRTMAEALLALAGHDMSLANISLEFPSGSMFWFRVKALRGLFRAGLQRYHFDAEAGQVDGTLAHAIERIFFMLVEAEGYDWARFCSREKLFGYRVTDNILFARSRILPLLAANDPVVVKLSETKPFFCRAIENPRPRLNLLIPMVDQKMGYAGVSEAIRQFRAIGKKLGSEVELRIISTDVPFNNMTIPPSGFSISESLVDDRDMAVVPGFLRGTEPLGLRENDIFIASAWWTAKQAYELIDAQAELFGDVGHRRMVYLIQDFEPGFYAWSTRWALAENTYRHPDRTIAVFNTPLLADFMTERYTFSAVQTFLPMINEDLMIPDEDQMAFDKRDKIVLLYARPHAERNCLEMIDAIVSYCVEDSPDFWSDWRFLAIGETFGPNLVSSDRIEVLGRLSLEEYRGYLAKSRLGVSIMVSPHPSYPPLEMAANGIRVLTNTYDGKDLSKLHENLVSFTMFDPAVLARRLKAMAEGPATPGKPLIDWFFDGGNNLDSVAEAVAAELRENLAAGA